MLLPASCPPLYPFHLMWEEPKLPHPTQFELSQGADKAQGAHLPCFPSILTGLTLC